MNITLTLSIIAIALAVACIIAFYILMPQVLDVYI